MPALNSLVAQPGSQNPPQIQGADSQQPSGLQGVVGQGQSGPNMQPPSHQETVAILQHISAFHRRWVQMLKDPEIGAKDMRGDIQDMMADMMADDYASLPEVMGLLKQIPTKPLEQRQWIEKHIQNDTQAMAAVLNHRSATAPPPGAWEQEMAQAGQINDDNRSALVKGAVSRYKTAGKRQPKNMRVPING